MSEQTTPGWPIPLGCHERRGGSWQWPPLGSH
jgi:hypothetical protein